MRMRRKKNAEARIDACREYLISAKDEIDALRADGKMPIRLEIGCGKGDFAIAASKKYSDRPFIAVEVISDVALLALEKAKAAKCDNVKFLIANAKDLTDYFQKGDVETLYLNFSDPWPKKGYYKRRLTYRSFLKIYESIMTDEGEICFKTDNKPFFDFSLDEFKACGLVLFDKTEDLHHSIYNDGNIETEYERNFSNKGFPINAVKAKLPRGGIRIDIYL